ncbi:transposase [uncultured Roseobacter sp.]|uniref:transposase n=1 Tax=uncultured Roseobacter sp. TaxID=114847 RepID=UPI002617DEE1|nr:transposase [uncultured Roseobacter sp.]
MQYDTCSRCVFNYRYHIVWSTKFRFEVLHGDVRPRVRHICRKDCREQGVDIIRECSLLTISTCSCPCRANWR